ncbi:MAG: SDR family oxidoreductase [Candidatus Binataceae bacterium]
MGKLTGKIAIVTGASRGIGRAISLRLAHEGAAVAVNYLSDARKADDAVSTIISAGGKAIAIRADIARRGEITKLFDEAEARLGKIDIVVSNAGVLKAGALAEVSERDFDLIFALNARGGFFVMQEAARRLDNGGRIISLSSSVTIQPLPYSSAYAGSKAAIELFTKVLARELGPCGITVNAVAPGGTDTEMLSMERKEELKGFTALRRLGQPSDIADVVAFIASEDARWITGQVIHVNGGQA